MSIKHITTPAELQAMKDSLSDDYILDNDIDLSGVTWTPVGTKAAPFTGSLDGNNYIIRNLTLAITSDYAGLFGVCYNANVENIGLEDFVLNILDTSYAGTLVGDFSGNIDCEISNCYSKNIKINSTGSGKEFNWVGGLIGYASNETVGKTTTIAGCYVTGNIDIVDATSESYAMGGFIGGTDGVDISSCYSDVEMNITGLDYSSLGGFVGFINDGDNNNILEECYSSGDITISNIDDIFGIGGFCGNSDDDIGVDISECYSIGSITFTDCPDIADVGGFIGCLTGTLLGIVNKCYSDSNIVISSGTDVSDVGGFIGNLDDGNITDCYAHGYISAICDTIFGCGGFIGNSSNPTSGSTVKNCYSSGNVISVMSGSNSGCSIGGFIGCDDDFCLINCYSVGNVKITCDSFDTVGGFAGYISSTTTDPVNCAWYDHAYDYAIGEYKAIVNVETLEEKSLGTDEEDNTTFWYKTHIVYDQGNANAWDFATPIWYERYIVEEYPTFEGVTVDTTNEPAYQGGGQIIKDQFSANQIPVNEPRKLFWSHFHQKYICAMCLARVPDKKHEIKFDEGEKEFSNKIKSMGYING